MQNLSYAEPGTRRRLADTALVLVALIWGLNFVVIKETLLDISPLYYLAIRFVLAGGIMVLWVWGSIQTMTRRQGVLSLVAGVLLFGGFSIQTIALQYTTPGLSAFLTATYVLMVPLGNAMMGKFRPEPQVLAGIIVLVAGMALLFLNGPFELHFGELLTLISALFFATHIILLGQISRSIPTGPLAAIQLTVVGILSLVLAMIFETPPMAWAGSGFAAILYGALFGSLAAYVIQSWAQRVTSPSHTGLLLSLESIFALIFSLLLGMDTLSWRSFLGFGAVLIGIVTAEWPRKQHYPNNID